MISYQTILPKRTVYRTEKKEGMEMNEQIEKVIKERERQDKKRGEIDGTRSI